ncbi:4Fe-4S binding protein [Geomonas subterranea]|uniref:4Fe-4S binding protein n=1 Tax=Geomonas subterranea TaxID=2847989 RepID=A0ABX8LFN7_9BACT|nr:MULTISPECIES: 4Fe-4S binding protein [Geomonas]QXE89504.1 4Fe-4S binding protein [Geomonas subterranea]QXM08381.1 4Fe-4S binding protein [Geomonas subterranea]
MKERIRDLALGWGVDDVGFASVCDYRSPNSPSIESLFPGARSMIVMAFRELAACESSSPQMAMSARLDLMEFSRSACYRMGRFVEGTLGSPAMTVPVGYPMDFNTPGKIGVGEVSLRHAAVAAGLGTFGRHNLVVHPRFGTRVIFTAILTKLELAPDVPVEINSCTDCGLCVSNCPAGALDDAGKTEVRKCLGKSQPFGMGANIAFWSRYGDATRDEQKAMLQSPEYLSLYQAGSIGYQYYCFRCFSVCPIGLRN